MDNNQVDKYFKENSHRFDEQPGADLWAKIEAGLDVAPTATKTVGKGRLFTGKGLLLLVSGIVLIGVLVVFFMPTKTDKKTNKYLPEVQPQQTVVAAQDTVSTAADTLKEHSVITGPEKAMKSEVDVLQVAPVAETDSIVMTNIPVVNQKPVQTLVPMQRKIRVSVQESAKRTVITIREKISQQKFDSITAASLEQYKHKAGMQLIIKSVQGYVYRYTFPAAEKLLVRGSVADTIKPRINNPKMQLEAVLIRKPVGQSLATDSISFTPKYDSITDTYYVQYGRQDVIRQAPVYVSQLTVQPEFPGGVTELLNFINKTFRYPQIGKELIAKVHVSFIIETDGSISNIKVLKDPGYGLGAEAVRVLKQLTIKWKPGEVKGKIVRTAYFMPITVKIK